MTTHEQGERERHETKTQKPREAKVFIEYMPQQQTEPRRETKKWDVKEEWREPHKSWWGHEEKMIKDWGGAEGALPAAVVWLSTQMGCKSKRVF